MEIEQFILQGFCLKCNLCCRFNQIDTIWTPKGIRPSPYKDYFICPHLNIDTNRCRIYLRRPFDCKLYPFVLTRKNSKVFLGLDSRCPYTKDKLKADTLKEYARYLVDLFSSEEFKGLLKKEPGLVANYDEDIAILKELPISLSYKNETPSP